MIVLHVDTGNGASRATCETTLIDSSWTVGIPLFRMMEHESWNVAGEARRISSKKSIQKVHESWLDKLTECDDRTLLLNPNSPSRTTRQRCQEPEEKT